MNETPAPPSPRVDALSRLLIIALALASLFLAGFWMTKISRVDPWYRNTDMNMQNLDDALSINSDVPPRLIDQPGLPLTCLLAIDYRIRHYLGLLPVWNVKKFGDSKDPLREIPVLIRIGRVHSRVLVVLFILSAAWLTYSVSRAIEPACLTVILLSGSSGLLFHGLLTRPELLCVGFGNVLALLFTDRALTARSWFGHHIWLFFAGTFVGLSALEKLPGVCFLPLCYGWCWMAALTPSLATRPGRTRPPYWSGLLPAAGGGAVLFLFLLLSHYHDALGPVVISRLRLASFLVAVLPLLMLWPKRNRGGLFLLDRGRELALLAGGALFALPLSYLGLRAVLSAPTASDYLARTLHLLIDPAPLIRIVAANPNVGQVFAQFIRETPFLFIFVPVVTVGTCCVWPIPQRLKAFMILLLAGALSMTLMLSKRHFSAQYSVFPQVPFLLVLSVGLFALGSWWSRQCQVRYRPWAMPAIIVVAFAFALTVYPRVYHKYTNYQSDSTLPVSDLTLTFIFDHDTHTQAYLQAMKDHYGTRDQFAETLKYFLADPANRY